MAAKRRSFSLSEAGQVKENRRLLTADLVKKLLLVQWPTVTSLTWMGVWLQPHQKLAKEY